MLLRSGASKKWVSMSCAPARKSLTTGKPKCRARGSAPTAEQTEKRPPTQSQKPNALSALMPKASTFCTAVLYSGNNTSQSYIREWWVATALFEHEQRHRNTHRDQFSSSVPDSDHVLSRHRGGVDILALEAVDQPLLHGAGVEHGLRRGEGLGHHDGQGGLGVEAGQGAGGVNGVHVLYRGRGTSSCRDSRLRSVLDVRVRRTAKNRSVLPAASGAAI
jgi:hypothetical protein